MYNEQMHNIKETIWKFKRLKVAGLRELLGVCVGYFLMTEYVNHKNFSKLCRGYILENVYVTQCEGCVKLLRYSSRGRYPTRF